MCAFVGLLVGFPKNKNHPPTNPNQPPNRRLTDAIIRGRGGGETLRMETALFGVREKVSNRAIKRLREAVVSRTLGACVLALCVSLFVCVWSKSMDARTHDACTHLISSISHTTHLISTGQPLLLLLATQRQQVVLDRSLETAKDIWKAGTIFDKCASVFIQVKFGGRTRAMHACIRLGSGAPRPPIYIYS